MQLFYLYRSASTLSGSVLTRDYVGLLGVIISFALGESEPVMVHGQRALPRENISYSAGRKLIVFPPQVVSSFAEARHGLQFDLCVRRSV